MNILTSSFSDKAREAQVVSAENQDDYQEPIPINPLFKPAFMAVYQQSELKRKNLVVDNNMSKEEAESRFDVGVFEARFNGWSCTLNWTEEKKGNLYPDYIGIDFGDTSCGIIGKWATIRTCWKCGMTGWRDEGRKNACVLPCQYNDRTGIWEMHPCPNCASLDWWARTILPDHFVRDCAEAIAEGTGRENLWTKFGGEEMDHRLGGDGA